MKNINIKNISLDIEDIIKKDKRFLDDKGEIIKSELIEKVISLDTDLIKLLTKNHNTLNLYFTKVDTTLVFDKQKFLDFISSSEFLPKSYTAFENQIGLINENRKLLSNSREIVLNFPFKDCILEGGQDKGSDGRDEVFFNTILAPDEIDRLKEPKALVNFKKYTKDGPTTLDKIDHEKDNLILRGNNLLALYSLLPKYRGKVKLIYIDPPYNTGSDDFKYNDKFNHSTWLVFMKNRLEIARDLLSSDGSIFIQCDDNEQAYLKVLCDEIFNRDNFRSQISWLRSSSGKTISRNLPNDVDYLLWYSKTDKYNFNPVYKPLSEGTIAMYNKDDGDGRGKYRIFPLQKTGGPGPETSYDYKDNNGKIWKCPSKGWRMKYEKLKSLENDGRLYIAGSTIGEKAYWNERENEGKLANNLWDDIYNLQGSNTEKIDFVGQKPELLIKRIIEMTTTNAEDVVLDYHLGSGTTCAVAHKMGRRYIGIEQLNYGDSDAVVRLANVILGDDVGISKNMKWSGGGSFVYAELLKNNQKFVEEIEKVKSDKDLKKIYKEMQEEAFFRYDIDIQRLKDKSTEKSFDELDFNSKKNVLLDCLDANHLYVNYSDIEDSIFKVDKKDVVLNKKFYE